MWFDLKLDISRKSAQIIYREVFDEEPREDAELYDLLSEMLTMIQGRLKHAFQEAANETMSPVIPRVIEGIKGEFSTPKTGCKAFVVKSGDAQIQFTGIETNSPMIGKNPSKLKPLDIIADPVTAPGSRVRLVEKGLVLNDKKIDLLERHETRSGEDMTINIFNSSPFARDHGGIT